MNLSTALRTLVGWDARGRYVWTTRDLAKLFPEDSPKAFEAGLARLVRGGVLRRACKGIYVLPEARSDDGRTLERVARALRRGRHSYVSLESALSEHGAISQVMPDRLTIMTTGRRGTVRTPWGTLELTHTRRPAIAVLDATLEVGRPLRLASARTAWRDLKRVGRNVHLVDVGALDGD